MSAGKILLGTLAGVAAGALIGILFAPDKGTETRRKIVEKGEDYTDSLKNSFNDLIDSLLQKVERVKKGASDFVEQAKTHVKSPDTETVRS